MSKIEYNFNCVLSIVKSCVNFDQTKGAFSLITLFLKTVDNTEDARMYSDILYRNVGGI